MNLKTREKHLSASNSTICLLKKHTHTLFTHSLQSGLTFSASKWILMDLNTGLRNHRSNFGNKLSLNKHCDSHERTQSAADFKQTDSKQDKWKMRSRYWIQEHQFFSSTPNDVFCPRIWSIALQLTLLATLVSLLSVAQCFWQFYRLGSERLQYLWS